MKETPMLQVLTIVLAIAFSNVPPQTVRGETQGSGVTASASAVDPPVNQPGGGAVDPPVNQPGGGN